jgi:MFS family permease
MTILDDAPVTRVIPDDEPAAKAEKPSTSAQKAPSLVYSWMVVIILFICYTISAIDAKVMTLMVADVRQDLNLDDFQISLLQGFATVVLVAVAAVPIGRIVDNGRNRSKLLAGGIILWCLATAASGLSRTFGHLFAARVAVGIGESTLGPTAYSLISDYFEPKRRAFAISVFALGYPVGGGLALIIGAYVLQLAKAHGAVVVPIIGLVQPWQMVFFIVGLPGLLVAGLVMLIREPKRHASPTAVIGVERLTLRETGAFLAHRWKVYSSLIGSVSLLGMLAIGTSIWYPTFLIRTFGMTATEAGYSFGTLMIVCGGLGNLVGGWFSGFFMRRGHPGANLNIMIWVTLVKVAPLVIGPLMPTAGGALLLMGIATFIGQGTNSVALASLQDITPSRLRGQMTALMLMSVITVGMGLGSTVIAAMTQFVFHDDGALRYSLAILPAVVGPLVALMFFLARKPYRAAMIEMGEWHEKKKA